MNPPPPGVTHLAQAITRAPLRWGPVRTAMAGFLLLQVAWIIAVPPFRGSDEFDHTYRAAAVARGEWVAEPSNATRETGAFVHVPVDIVEAAGPECRRFPYTTDLDCTPRGDGEIVAVASGAGRYNPLFYFLVGSPALPFDGTAALYVMRGTTALLSLLLLGAALTVAHRRWSNSWPMLGIALASTPVLVFSTVIVAPNGVELTSALAFWVALSALVAQAHSERPPSRALVAVLGASGSTLLLVRSLGPLWFTLISIAVLISSRVDLQTVRRLSAHGRTRALAAVLVLAGTAGVAWTWVMGSLTLSAEKVRPHSRWEIVASVAREVPLWILQSIAAFPARDVAAPAIVYAAGLVLLVGVVLLALRHVPGSVRRAAWFVALLSVLVPAAATFDTFSKYGTAWQGRYTLPFALGLVIVLCVGLATVQRRVRSDLVLLGLVAYVTVQTVGAVALVVTERKGSPGLASGAWFILPTPVMALLFVAGSTLVWLSACSRLPGLSDHDEPAEEDSATAG